MQMSAISVSILKQSGLRTSLTRQSDFRRSQRAESYPVSSTPNLSPGLRSRRTKRAFVSETWLHQWFRVGGGDNWKLLIEVEANDWCSSLSSTRCALTTPAHHHLRASRAWPPRHFLDADQIATCPYFVGGANSQAHGGTKLT